MKKYLIFYSALFFLVQLKAQNGKTFIQVLSNHHSGMGIDMVSPSKMFQKSDSTFMIFGTIREGADRRYPVYQQYNRYGNLMQSNDFNPGFSRMNFGFGSVLETSDKGILLQGGTGWQGDQAVIKYNSNMLEEWRLTKDSLMSSSSKLIEHKGFIYSFFAKYYPSGSLLYLLKFSLDSGKMYSEKSVLDLCSSCDSVSSDQGDLLMMNDHLYGSVFENVLDKYDSLRYRYFELDTNLNHLASKSYKNFPQMGISTFYKLENSRKAIFFQDTINSHNQNVLYSVTRSFEYIDTATNFQTNISGKIYSDDEFYDKDQNLFVRVSTCTNYPDTAWEFCVEYLMMFNGIGDAIRKYPLNHKDSTGRYRNYTITNLQKTLDGGFAFTIHEPPGHGTYPWHLVVTDSNMLVDGKPFWYTFYDGDTTKTVGFNEPSSAFNSNIYPNPTSQFIHIELSQNQTLEYSFLNLNGQSLLQGNFEQSTQINVSNLPNGLYFLHLQGEGILETRKIVVQH
ncbi:MAG: T9SS type A sorting domain-containing protein [Flavobacteriales bacterium]|nr:T9SS type A sorting domain-containing protein [Flavobacteriales bacterium]